MTNSSKREKRALLSVFNKEGIDTFAKGLVEAGYEIVSSGGTSKYLIEKGIAVTDVAEITGAPAMLGHRVVTLHPKIHGGLLATDTPEHDVERAELGIPWIELVCGDLYPLQEAISEGKTDAEITEMVDMGGPALLASAAKGDRIVVCDPADRTRVLEWVKEGEPDGETFRRQLRAKADFIVSSYRLLTARHFGNGEFEGITGTRVVECKGENAPQSPAGFYSADTGDPLALGAFTFLEGSPLSYNNWCDVDRSLKVLVSAVSAYRLSDIEDSKVIIGVKHGNPCGVGVRFGSDTKEATKVMVESDPLSLFGGLVISNFAIGVDEATILVQHMTDEAPKRILDAVVAPGFSPEALEMLRRKKGGCRFLVNEALGDERLAPTTGARMLRPVRGGFLAQGEYEFILDWNHEELQITGEVDEATKKDLLLAWAIGSRSNSNTITIVKDGQLLGNGTGQQSRVDAAKLALARAVDRGHDLSGASAYSDSFFPFPDGPLTLTDAGVTAIFATRGSINDEKVAGAVKGAGASFVTLPDSIARGFFGH
jgi:phosphoribosylaminoimidazolecarboxamide formyltransferase/IMP cyclohydrolase